MAAAAPQRLGQRKIIGFRAPAVTWGQIDSWFTILSLSGVKVKASPQLLSPQKEPLGDATHQSGGAASYHYTDAAPS
ncbi:unnamed protein product [Boreogadus saida]